MGESDVPTFGPSANLSGHQLHHSSGVCPQIQRRQCGAYVGAVEEIVCVMCVGVAEGYSGAGCYLVSTLCKYDLRKGYLATSEAGSLCKGVMDVVIFQLHHRLNQ